MTAPAYLTLGFGLHYKVRVSEPPERAEKIASLMWDARWPWQPTKFYRPRLPWIRGRKERGILDESNAHDLLRETLLDPKLRNVSLKWADFNERNEDLPSAIEIDGNDTVDLRRLEPAPCHAFGHTRAAELPSGKSVDAWVELVHELAVTLEARAGVLCVYPTWWQVDDDIRYSQMPRPAPGDPAFLEPEDFYKGESVQRDIGGKYARFPRFGTYLNPEHVAALGGRKRIIEAIDLDEGDYLVRDVGNLLYVQLGPEVAGPNFTGWGQLEAMHIFRLMKFMAPVLPPFQLDLEPRDETAEERVIRLASARLGHELEAPDAAPPDERKPAEEPKAEEPDEWKPPKPVF